MSPSCLATIFEGDNGGATTTGVTATEIRVSVPIQYNFGAQYDEQYQAVMRAMFDHVNSRYEFYGRRLVPVFTVGSTVDAGDAPKARAAALQIANQSVFSALVGTLELFGSYPQAALLSGLASAGVVTIVHNKSAWWSDRLVFDEMHPYVWSVHPSSEGLQAQLGAVACRMASGTARGPAGELLGPRKFGIVSVGQQIAPRVDVVSNAIEACTGTRPAKIEGTFMNGSASSASVRPSIERFAADGVTTIICACERTSLYVPIQAAVDAQKSFEFLYPQSADYDGDEWLGGARYETGKKKNPLYAVTHGLRVELPQNYPWFPIIAGNPAFISSSGSNPYGSNIAYTFRIADAVYLQLMMLAAGVQSAGPNLSAESFARGLQTTTFPNSEANRPPSWLPAVGFGPGDHSYFGDFGLAKWDPTMPAVTPAAAYPMGSWCYVGAGERFTVQSLPANLESRLFGTEPCR